MAEPADNSSGKTLREQVDPAYRRMLEEAAKEKLDHDFSNSSCAHAIVATECLMVNTVETLRLLTGKFLYDFYHNLTNAFETFFSDSQKKMEVIAVDPSMRGMVLLQHMSAGAGDRLSVFQINEEKLKDKLRLSPSEISNFLLADPVGYRFELSDKEVASSRVTGIVNFGDKPLTDGLRDMFELLKTNASTRIKFV